MRRVAMGDPQAPFERVLAILDRHHLLRNGRLRDDVVLVSMGDHFDWGGVAMREQSTREATELLTWLSSHSPEQVVLLAGNHDLSRVGELAPFSDAEWRHIRSEADAVKEGRLEEAEFLRRYPHLPTAEVAFRDIAAFETGQRDVVSRLLQNGRFQIAHAQGDLLLTHTGVTVDDLAAIGAHDALTASEMASALNSSLNEAVRLWDGQTSFHLPGLYRPGDASFGEARGMLFHRPANPAAEPDQTLFTGPFRRRYDPRRLPKGIVQGIGHIRDNKCRKLLGPWADDEPAVDGPLRTLVVRGDDVRYSRGARAVADEHTASILFLDGGMQHASPEDYELLDLDTLQPYRA